MEIAEILGQMDKAVNGASWGSEKRDMLWRIVYAVSKFVGGRYKTELLE